MGKIYALITILAATMISLTGCHASSNTPVASSNAPSPEQLKIDEINKHVRELTKQFEKAQHNLWISSGERARLANKWVEEILKKYSNSQHHCVSMICKQQTGVYENYRQAVTFHQPLSTDAHGYDPRYDAYLQFNNMCADIARPLWEGTFFVYDPTNVQDKTELLIRVHDFMEKLEHVQIVINQGLHVSFQGIAPQWKPIVESLHKKLSFENNEAIKAHHDLMAIKEWIAGLPD